MSFALETPVIVSPEGERKLIVDIPSRLGANQQECSIQADVLTECDLRGHHSHGLQRLPVLATRIKKGLIRVYINPAYTWAADLVLSVDGKDGLGTVVAFAFVAATRFMGGQRFVLPRTEMIPTPSWP